MHPDSRLTLQLDDEQIRRVEALMVKPFDKLSAADQDQRQTLAVQRLRETLCSVPWYATSAAKWKARTGDEWGYWSALWGSGVNMLHPAMSLA